MQSMSSSAHVQQACFVDSSASEVVCVFWGSESPVSCWMARAQCGFAIMCAHDPLPVDSSLSKPSASPVNVLKSLMTPDSCWCNPLHATCRSPCARTFSEPQLLDACCIGGQYSMHKRLGWRGVLVCLAHYLSTAEATSQSCMMLQDYQHTRHRAGALTLRCPQCTDASHHCIEHSTARTLLRALLLAHPVLCPCKLTIQV